MIPDTEFEWFCFIMGIVIVLLWQIATKKPKP
jgi:hypothetical protein